MNVDRLLGNEGEHGVRAAERVQSDDRKEDCQLAEDAARSEEGDDRFRGQGLGHEPGK